MEAEGSSNKKKLDADLQEEAEKRRAQVTRAEWQCV